MGQLIYTNHCFSRKTLCAIFIYTIHKNVLLLVTVKFFVSVDFVSPKKRRRRRKKELICTSDGESS